MLVGILLMTILMLGIFPYLNGLEGTDQNKQIIFGATVLFGAIYCVMCIFG